MVSNSSPTRRFSPVKSLSYSDIDEIEEQLEHNDSDSSAEEGEPDIPVKQPVKARPSRSNFDFDSWEGEF